MDLEKRLNAVGKAVFVKYYFVFANMDNEDCMEMFTENFTENTKRSKTYHAKAIFRERKQFEALKIICNSPRIDEKIQLKARHILFTQNRKKRYVILDGRP